MSVDSKRERLVPDWATAAFDRFVDQTERLWNVTRLSCHGISLLRGIPNTVGTLAAIKEIGGEKEAPEHKDQLERARKDADLAQREVDSGFPLVFSHAIVTLWSLLESTTRATVVAWLRNNPDSFRAEAIARLRVRIGEYEQLVDEERYYYIAELLEGELGAGIRNGVERFESLLRPFGLDGAIPERLRRDMFEFGQIRNTIVHSGGVTDRQLTTACPWLGFSVGVDIPITGEHFHRYQEAAQSYSVVLMCRVAVKFGGDVSAHATKVLAKYDAT